jgi:hypothetical protein
MTLRDYFAAQALVGMLAHNHADYPKYWAEKAYSFADDMMKARGGG